MEYNKPTLRTLGKAVDAIQSSCKQGCTPDHTNEPSTPAYEADE